MFKDVFNEQTGALNKLQEQLVRDLSAGGKLNSHQSDWIVNELKRVTSDVNELFQESLSSRLTAIKQRLLKRKYLTEAEVSLHRIIV